MGEEISAGVNELNYWARGSYERISSYQEHRRSTEGLAEVVWQKIERLAAFIFEENNFQVETGEVKTLDKKRRQYDVIARKCGRTILAEMQMGTQWL